MATKSRAARAKRRKRLQAESKAASAFARGSARKRRKRRVEEEAAAAAQELQAKVDARREAKEQLAALERDAKVIQEGGPIPEGLQARLEAVARRVGVSVDEVVEALREDEAPQERIVIVDSKGHSVPPEEAAKIAARLEAMQAESKPLVSGAGRIISAGPAARQALERIGIPVMDREGALPSAVEEPK